MFEKMQFQYQQTRGDEDESAHRKSFDDPGDSAVIDGYSGPRSRMVYGKRNDNFSETNPSRGYDPKLGILERITLAGLAALVTASIIASLIILPFAIAGFFFWKGIKSSYIFFNKLLTGRRPR